VSALRRLLRARWSILRVALAVFCLWTLGASAGERLARSALAALPDYDAATEARALAAQGRYAEALALAESAAALASPQSGAQLAALAAEIDDQRASFARRASDFATGAALGGPREGRDASIEALAGAVITDFFLVGDLRDLTIQSVRFARGEETDEVIVALSAVGVATTLAPAVDAGASLLKILRRLGVLGEKFADELVTLFRAGRRAELESAMAQTADLATRLSPAGAARVLRSARGTDELAAAADFLARRGDGAALAFHAAPAASLRLAGDAAALRRAGRLADADALESAVLTAARKGPRGMDALSRPAVLRALTAPRPILGALKGIWKGTLPDLVARTLARLDAAWNCLLPLVAAWTVLELCLLAFRLFPRADNPRDGLDLPPAHADTSLR
jgi:hypothetical protein